MLLNYLNNNHSAFIGVKRAARRAFKVLLWITRLGGLFLLKAIVDRKK